MLKMRLVWRRTSSSQADPSPWRHCWTSWASCSNHQPQNLLRCKACLRVGLSQSRPTVHLGLPTMERKMLSKCSPAGSALTADRYNRYLTQQVAQRQENQWGAGLLGSQRCSRNENIVPLPPREARFEGFLGQQHDPHGLKF